MSEKRDILLRINLIFGAMCVIAALIFIKAAKIQIIEGEKWRNIGRSYSKIDTISGKRGDLYDCNEKLLATSIPSFEIHFDAANKNVDDEEYLNAIDSIALLMNKRFTIYSKEEYKTRFMAARKEKNRYYLLLKEADFTDVKEMRTWPLFRDGKYRGGLIVHQNNARIRPYERLGERTIGYSREYAQSVGIEEKFHDFLRGEKMSRVMQKVSGGEWIPVYEINGEPQAGNDVITNIDITLQDIADKALQQSLVKNNADHGCVVVMEVKTGKIKAMVNLGKERDNYYENYNYAIAESAEPGSTFKIASMLSLIKDKKVDASTMVDVASGKAKYADIIIKDDHPTYDSLDVSGIIAKSSNVGISKLIIDGYKNNPQQFIDNLKEMYLHEVTGVDLTGEAAPYIKETTDKLWNKNVSLPVMSFGYEVKLTPLQTLSFINAIANDGEMMKPYLISEVRAGRESLKRYGPVSKGKICTRTEAEYMRKLLEEVVVSGTASAINKGAYRFAGKTGTAKVASGTEGYNKVRTYQSSFVGYFPADSPKYSCIVIVRNPTNGDIYGASVAAPVFKEIAEKYLSIQKDILMSQPPLLTDSESIPSPMNGYKKDICSIYKAINISVKGNPVTDWAQATISEKRIKIENRVIKDNQIPDVKGMGLRDAIYILENMGLKVVFNGKGKVKRQYPDAGIPLEKEDVISLELG